jgi:hypothetical protein
VQPGDTLKFVMDGSGAGGNGIPTFGAWDVTLTERTLVPEPATAGLLALAAGLFWGIGRRRG